MRAAFLAAALAMAACARAGAAPDNECTGAAPLCYESVVEGCCADAGAPAECGPKDAPRGTHLKWVCPGKSVRVGECKAYGPECAAHNEQVASTLATPHAVSVAGDPTSILPQGWLDASAGAVLADRTEALSTFYSVRRYTTRTKAPENARDHEDLYFGKDRLTEKRYFVAPSGDSVVYEDGAGKLFVHGAISGKKVNATPRPFESPTGAAWDAQKRTVTVSFAKRAAVTAKLP